VEDVIKKIAENESWNIQDKLAQVLYRTDGNGAAPIK